MPTGTQHKFIWSNPCNTYTLTAICEYCGLLAFHSNGNPSERNKEECRKPCQNTPPIIKEEK